MNTTLARFVTILLLLLSFCFTATGQATTGKLDVVVLDTTGSPIPGATVKITPKGKTAGGAFLFTTNDSGLAKADNLQPGEYRLEASATGFFVHILDTVVRTFVKNKESISLSVGGTSVVVDIVDNTPQGSPKSIKTAADKLLPSDPTLNSLLDIARNVRDEQIAAGISIDGGTGSDNTYYVDGHEVNNVISGGFPQNFNLPFSLTQEVSVSSGAETAQYQGSIGGIVNIVTQGGNDRWRGDIGFSFAPSGLNNGERPILTRFGNGPGQIEYFTPNKDDSNAYFPSGSIGGPIVKGKLWGFASYSPQIFENKRTVDYNNTNQPGRTITESIDYEQSIRQEFAYARIDAQPLKTVTGGVSFLWSPTIQDGRLPAPDEGLGGSPQFSNGLTGAALLASQGGRANANMINGRLAWNPTENFILNLRAGRSFENNKLNAYGANEGTRYACSTIGSPQNQPGSNCAPGFNTGSNFVSRFNVSKRETFDIDAGIKGVNFLGRHNINFGYQFNRAGNEIDEGYAETGYIVLYYGRPITTFVNVQATPGNLGSGLMQRFGTIANDRGINHSLYGQTNWQIADRVTLDLGVRFESEDVADFGFAQTVDFDWSDKISPRLGISVDPHGDGKTRVFASYFWNYDRLKFGRFQALGGDVFARDYFEILPSRGVAFNDYTYANILGGDTDPNNIGCPLQNSPGYSVCRFGFNIPSQLPVFPFPQPPIDPDLRPTRQETFVAGATHEVVDGWFIDGRYIRKNLKDVVEDLGYFNDQGSENNGLGNPGRGIFCTANMSAGFPCPEATREYDGLELSIDRRSWSYFFNASYTWSRLVGSYSGLASSDELGRASPNISRSFDLPSGGFTANGASDSGRLPIERPHILKVYGGYSFNLVGDQKTDVAAFTTIQSGTPLTTFYNLYGLTTSVLFERGDLGRTEKFSETDLRIGHRFSFGDDGKFGLEIFSNIQNLFDEKNELGRQTQISDTNYTSAVLSANGCTTCGFGTVSVYDTLFNQGGIRQFVQNQLNTQGLRNDYNLSNSVQNPRSVRFGARFSF